jgi:type III secretion protein C
MRLMRVRFYHLFFASWMSLWAQPENLTIPELVETYLQHPDFIANQQSICEGGFSNDSSSFFFQVPKDNRPQGTYLVNPKQEGATNQKNPEPFVYPEDYKKPDHATILAPVSPKEGKDLRLNLSGLKDSEGPYKVTNCDPQGEGFTVNFENISVVELLQFISQISGVNFIFDSADLQFKISILSQEAASVTELTSALLQILKMHNLNVVEQGNTVIIYKQQNLSKVSKVITDANIQDACGAAIITRVFKLFNLDPEKIAAIVKPLLSTDAIVEVSSETRHLIVSDMTYNVDKIAQLLNALDMPNTTFEVAEYTVNSAYPESIVAYAKQILAPLLADNPMQMISQGSTGKIFIVSTPYVINKALQLLKSLDSADITLMNDLPPTSLSNNAMFMYKLKYHPGKDIADSLHMIGSNLQTAGSVNTDLANAAYSAQFLEINNSIVITGTQDAVSKVVELMDQLDQPPKQVYLEVLVIDTTLTNSLDFGVQWIGLGNEQNKLAYASGLLSDRVGGGADLQGNITPPIVAPGARNVAANGTPPLVPNPGRDISLPTPANLRGFTDLVSATEAFGFGIIGNIISHKGQSFLTLGALVSALEEEGSTKLVLNPRIMAQDTQPADIFVGKNIPYQTTSSIIQQTGSVTQNIQYEDVGVHLRITPTIAPNNIVSLDIDQTIAEDISVVGSLTPTTTKTLTTTRLHVPDGCFLVMSGHIRDNNITVHSGVPCLGCLPLIGPVFSRTVDQREKRNLIMFVRPKVVTNIQEELDLTNQEGYDYNWEACPDSMIQCGPKNAPECETYPPRPCPCN